METQRRSNGWLVFLEHSGFAVTCVVGVLTLECLLWLSHLRGAGWVQAYYAAMALGSASVALLLYAKWPQYRCGRFLVPGAIGLTGGRRRFYWSGLALAALDIVVLTCLNFAHE